MILVQTGYFGNVGPVFVTSVSPKVIIWQGVFENGELVLRAKDPAYADYLKNFGSFSYQASECTLDTFKAEDKYPEPCDGFRVPPYDGSSFNDYREMRINSPVVNNDWVYINMKVEGAFNSIINGGFSNGINNVTSNANVVRQIIPSNNAPSSMSNGLKSLLVGAGLLLGLAALSNDD